MGYSHSSMKKMPLSKKATNAGFAKQSVTTEDAGTTSQNQGGKSFRGDVRRSSMPGGGKPSNSGGGSY